MKANYTTMSKTKARVIAQEEVTKFYEDIFRECAADVMHQTIATFLLYLERDKGYGKKRLKDAVEAIKGWCDIMDNPGEGARGWSTVDNIEYFKKKYGIDLREEFKAEIKNSAEYTK